MLGNSVVVFIQCMNTLVISFAYPTITLFLIAVITLHLKQGEKKLLSSHLPVNI